MSQKRIQPGPNQESVWDYPRPPRIEHSDEKIQMVFNGIIIAESQNSYRILETSHPPVYCIPPTDVKMEYFSPSQRRTWCEWKGQAAYYNITVDNKTETNAAWYYPSPTPKFRAITNYIAVYPSLMDACYLNDELVQAQEGDFYGGWITQKIVGPFKGAPGTMGW